MCDDNQTYFVVHMLFHQSVLLLVLKKRGYEIVKEETRYLWFFIKHVTVPKKIAIIHSL